MRLQEEQRLKELTMTMLELQSEKDQEESSDTSPARKNGRRHSRFAISSVDDTTLSPTAPAKTSSSLLSPSHTWTQAKFATDGRYLVRFVLSNEPDTDMCMV